MQVTAAEGVQHGGDIFGRAEVGFGLRGRAVFHAAQHDMRVLILGREMFYRVENGKFAVGQHYIGVAVHDLGEQEEGRLVLHLGARREHDADYAVVFVQEHPLHQSRAEMFSEQHTKGVSAGGVGFLARSEVHSRRAGVAGDDEHGVPAARRAEKETDLIRLGLHDLVHSCAAESGVEFVRESPERDAVTAHTGIIHANRRSRNAKSG